MSKKKLRILLIIFLIITFLLLIIFKDNSYSKVYDIDEYKVTEEFNDKQSYYYFQIKYNSLDYELLINHKYSGEKLITNITKYSEKEELCLVLELTIGNPTLVCSKDDKLINWNLISDNLKDKIPPELIKEYPENSYTEKDITIFNNIDSKIYIWNYKGFDVIENGKLKTLNIFEDDVYDTNLIAKVNNYIIIPNYNQKYNFNKIIVLNTKTDKIEEWELNYEISYDSYVMGSYENSIYLVDTKNKIQYELVPHKQKARIIATKNSQGLVYKKEWQKMTVNKMINNKERFIFNNIYNYQIASQKLYLSYINSPNKIQVTNSQIDKIVATNDNEVYYLSQNKLFYFNIYDGEKLLAQKEEWLFNNENKIFIIFNQK